MIREHYDAIQALLPGTMTVYRGAVPSNPSYPYVCLWGDLGDESSGGPDGASMGDVPSVLSLRARATYAGLTFDSVLVMARNVRAALSRKVPNVAGRRCGPLRQSSLMDVQVDRDVTIAGSGANPLFAVDEFALVSEKS